jgi:DNA-binding NtrC family response regulator
MTSTNHPHRSLILVDDEPLILQSYGQLLQTHLSCPVYTFSSPQDALQQVTQLNPGMIISDYLMPGMNGLKFLAQAQRLAPDCNSVIITGGAIDFEYDELDHIPGLKGILRKPLHWKELSAFVIDNWPDHSHPISSEPALVS